MKDKLLAISSKIGRDIARWRLDWATCRMGRGEFVGWQSLWTFNWMLIGLNAGVLWLWWQWLVAPAEADGLETVWRYVVGMVIGVVTVMSTREVVLTWGGGLKSTLARCHDCGWPGWWAVGVWIVSLWYWIATVTGLLMMVVLSVTKGDENENKFGPVNDSWGGLKSRLKGNALWMAVNGLLLGAFVLLYGR